MILLQIGTILIAVAFAVLWAVTVMTMGLRFLRCSVTNWEKQDGKGVLVQCSKWRWHQHFDSSYGCHRFHLNNPGHLGLPPRDSLPKLFVRMSMLLASIGVLCLVAETPPGVWGAWLLLAVFSFAYGIRWEFRNE